MYGANLQQVHPHNPMRGGYTFWVLLLALRSETEAENYIRSKHEDIDQILADQNVNYTEITTGMGKRRVYEKFNFIDGHHPLFLVFNKYPLSCRKKEPFMVIEWGKWANIEMLKNDVMAFANFFADAKFRKRISDAHDEKAWLRVLQFLKKHGVPILSAGASIASAIL